MDVLGCFLCLVLTIVLIALLVLSMRVVADTVSPLKADRPLWPWSITTYNGWNQSIPQRPVADAFFPRPWVL